MDVSKCNILISEFNKMTAIWLTPTMGPLFYQFDRIRPVQKSINSCSTVKIYSPIHI